MKNYEISKSKACSSVVGRATVTQAGRSQVRIKIGLLDFFNVHNPASRRTMTLEFILLLTVMNTRKSLLSKARPALKADNLTTNFEPIVQEIWGPRHLTTLWASTACLIWKTENCRIEYRNFSAGILMLGLKRDIHETSAADERTFMREVAMFVIFHFTTVSVTQNNWMIFRRLTGWKVCKLLY
jgi:hypothetical protein